jgi:asparagine synthase (glutamine-hydrolysing)
MSVQSGICHFDGATVGCQDFDQIRPILERYEHDSERLFCRENIGILHRAFHTTKESQFEEQPYATASGAMVTWDGRLDNREELVGELGGQLSIDSTDLAITASAYQKWGTDSFAKLIGDWALSIWNPQDQTLLLAKDCIGTRGLYYSIDKDRVTWSTTLDVLVRMAPKPLRLEYEYIAGWLSFFPAADLTPYVKIHSVAPSTFVAIRNGHRVTKHYWDFDASKRVNYRKDAEYEEHFRSLFSESVRRRLRSNAPILAELSGGIDSSSIVCMADAIVKQQAPPVPPVDTVSYFSDSEPNWDERAYFTRVEEKRGRSGCQILVRADEAFRLDFQESSFQPTPGSGGRTSAMDQLAAHIAVHGNRVVLSGIGGDEVMGGVPTPMPELQDVLARVKLRTLVLNLKVWALHQRRPWTHLLFEAACGFVPDILGSHGSPPLKWLCPDFAKRHRAALTGYRRRLKLFGSLPSFQENTFALNMLRRQLGCALLPSTPTYEKRYPYLDRSLLEFLYAIPREQLVRPGQRRSLMRRALSGIVPDDLLNRKRKAYVARTPMLAISAHWSSLIEMNRHMVSAALNIVNPEDLLKILQIVRCGREVPMVSLMRTLQIEAWLRAFQRSGLSSFPNDPVALANGRKTRELIERDAVAQQAGSRGLVRRQTI